MKELTEVEQVATKHWLDVGFNVFDIAHRIIASRHQDEHFRIFRAVRRE